MNYLGGRDVLITLCIHRDFGYKNLDEMQSTSMDLFSKCQKETIPNLDQANQEIERLRKCIDKQQIELQGMFTSIQSNGLP